MESRPTSAEYARQIRNTIWGVLIALAIAGATVGLTLMVQHNQREQAKAEHERQCVLKFNGPCR